VSSDNTDDLATTSGSSEAEPPSSQASGHLGRDGIAATGKQKRYWDFRWTNRAARTDAEAQSRVTDLGRAGDVTTVRSIKRRFRLIDTIKSESILQGYSDKIIFSLFLLAGFVALFSLKLTSVSPILVACLAVAGMIAYALLAWHIPRVPPRPDRLGDNFYYMGFVFTLASMSAALVDLQGGADVSTLIGSFGIALFSTIAGIAGRVLLQQFRTEVEDIETIIRNDLLNATQLLKGQLLSAVNDLESFRLGVKEKVEIQLQETLDDHRRASDEHLASLSTIVADLLERLGALFTSHDEALQQLNTSTGATVTALHGVVERLDNIRPPADLLDRKLEPVFTRIGAVIAGFEETAVADREQQRAWVEAVNQIRGTVSDIGRHTSRLRKHSQDMEKATTSGDALVEILEQLQRRFEGLVSSIASQEKTVEVAAKAMQDSQHVMAQNSTESQQLLLALQQSVGQAVSMLSDASSRLVSDMEGIANATSRQREIISTGAEDASRARQQIAEDLEASRTAVIELERAMAQTARTITSALTSSVEG
jgi:hypothetical protein